MKFRAVTRQDGDIFIVHGEAMGVEVDDTRTHGIAVNTKRTANRLAEAIEAGAVFTKPTVETNILGKTYVGYSCHVLSKYASSDLMKLGF